MDNKANNLHLVFVAAKRKIHGKQFPNLLASSCHPIAFLGRKLKVNNARRPLRLRLQLQRRGARGQVAGEEGAPPGIEINIYKRTLSDV